MKNIDITGIRFGRLVALKRNDEITKKRKTIYWDFLCDCGQIDNKRNNKILFYKGKKQSLSKWAKELNINYNKLRSRLQYGWSVERAFNE